MTHASNSLPETVSLDRLIDNRAPAVHHMAHRFMRSQNAAAELAQATLASAKSNPEAANAQVALDAYLFVVMHSIVLARLHRDPR